MALEQSQEQQEQHQSPIIITRFTCTYCKQTQYKSGYFTIFKDGGMQFFCSKKCADLEKKRRQAFICAQCGKPFETLTPSHKRKYCSGTCKFNGHYNTYKNFNWCDLCNKWIKKEDSVAQTAGTTIHYHYCKYKLKKDRHVCPICKNKLRTRKKYKRSRIAVTTTRTRTEEEEEEET